MSVDAKLDGLISDVSDLRVQVAHCSEKLNLLDEVRADQKQTVADLTALKAKAALVAGAIASMITAIGHFLGK